MKKLLHNKVLRFAVSMILVLALILVLDKSLIQNLKNSQVNIINCALIYFFAVSGMYLLLGLGGLMTMHAIAFMGFSAFVTGFLNTKMDVPIMLAMLCAIAATAVLSFIVGAPLLRLDGRALMFGTMGIIYIGTSIFQNFFAFTGGPNGTSGIEKIVLFGHKFGTFKDWFVLLAILAVLIVLLMRRIKNTSFGRSLMAIRDDATAAQCMGVNVYRTKVIAFVIAGTLTGFGGALYAVHNGTISASLFSFATQTKFLIMLMLGGVMSPVGTLFGCVLVNYLPEIARAAASYLNMLYGAMIVLMMIFMPMGLAGIGRDFTSKIRHNLKKKLAKKAETTAAKEGN